VRFVAGAVPVLLAASWALPAPKPLPAPRPRPADADPGLTGAGKLVYNIEWRLIHAGTAVVDATGPEGRVKLESAGLVSALFKVEDLYSVRYDEPFCATSSVLDAREGRRHRETSITFDRARNQATFIQRDLLNNTILRSSQTDIPNCVHDIVGAMFTLRNAHLEPGQSTELPVSDGRRAAQVKIEAQQREPVQTPAGSFNTIRYEANLLNGVVYTRKGRVFLWLSDDERKLPVQIRLRMQFPVSTVTLQLQKEERP
jgi:uncharacterized protein DUF3108